MKSIFAPALRYPRAWFLIGVLIAAVIMVLSLVPARELPKLGVSDKLEHAVAYVVLGFWFASVIARRDYLWLWVVLVAFGGVIEIAQGLMGLGREADWRDLIADTVGTVIGIALAATALGNWARLVERRLPGSRNARSSDGSAG